VRKVAKRLALSVESVRVLAAAEAARVVGGDRFTYVLGGCNIFDTGHSCHTCPARSCGC